MDNLKIISNTLIDEVKQRAENSPRKRINFNFHQLDEVYQRFLNVLVFGTYICPHKHSNPPKSESFLVLEGRLAILIFDDCGGIIEKHILDPNLRQYGVDISPNIWHSIVVLSEFCVCFEGKTGPYNPSTDKNFASWAPMENTSDSTAYLDSLLSKILK